MLPQRILWSHLDDFVLVEDEEMMLAVRRYLELAKRLPSLAGVAPLAAAMRLQPQLRGRQVALVLSGGNISPEEITLCLQRTAPVRSPLGLSHVRPRKGSAIVAAQRQPTSLDRTTGCGVLAMQAAFFIGVLAWSLLGSDWFTQWELELLNFRLTIAALATSSLPCHFSPSLAARHCRHRPRPAAPAARLGFTPWPYSA